MTYEEHHKVLVQYLLAKVEVQDWHGVSDAANDLRVLEATSLSTITDEALKVLERELYAHPAKTPKRRRSS